MLSATFLTSAAKIGLTKEEIGLEGWAGKMESELIPPSPITGGRSHHAEDALGVGQGGPLWGRTPRWESLAGA